MGYVQVNSLSGGERRRLQLAAVLVEKPNLLILDEPTNDLDLQTVEVVEDMLAGYKGCLLAMGWSGFIMELTQRCFHSAPCLPVLHCGSSSLYRLCAKQVLCTSAVRDLCYARPSFLYVL